MKWSFFNVKLFLVSQIKKKNIVPISKKKNLFLSLTTNDVSGITDVANKEYVNLSQ